MEDQTPHPSLGLVQTWKDSSLLSTESLRRWRDHAGFPILLDEGSYGQDRHLTREPGVVDQRFTFQV